MQGAGYLAIWSDLAPQDQTDWAHWITREHAAERVGVNGFLACRIFRALGVVGEPLLHSLRTRGRTRRRRSGLSGAAECADAMVATHHAPARQFRARRRPHRSFSRHRPGRHRRSPAPRRRAVLGRRHLVAELARLDRIIAARVLLTDIAQTSIKTREKGMRANDGSFAALLLIEGLDEAAVRDALHHLRKTLPAEDHGAIDDLPLYRLAFSLPKRLLPG